MLREALFAHDATFAACTVPHPQDDFLRVVLDGDRPPKEILLETLRELRAELDAYRRTVSAWKAHDAATKGVELSAGS